MAFSTTFAAPSSLPTATSSSQGFNRVSYAGGYWFSLTRAAASDTIQLRYASDPTGTWTLATLPSAPVGYTDYNAPGFNRGVVHKDGQWAFLNAYGNGSFAYVLRMVYATDPTGTWSTATLDPGTTTDGLPVFNTAGTVFVAGGATSTANNAWLGYGTSITGTWTIGTTSTATGYDPATRDWIVADIEYGNSLWLTTAYDATNGTAGTIKYASSFTAALAGGGWSSIADTTFGTASITSLRYQSNGVWTAVVSKSELAYSSDPTGSTWSRVSSGTLGLSRVWDVVYNDNLWLVSGARTIGGFLVPTLQYCTGATPTGPFTLVDDDGWSYVSGTDAIGQSLAMSSNRWLASTTYGNNSVSWWDQPATNPTYLRQRQSPVRAPSRVRPVQLRNRQRPEVT